MLKPMNGQSEITMCDVLVSIVAETRHMSKACNPPQKYTDYEVNCRSNVTKWFPSFPNPSHENTAIIRGNGRMHD